MAKKARSMTAARRGKNRSAKAKAVRGKAKKAGRAAARRAKPKSTPKAAKSRKGKARRAVAKTARKAKTKAKTVGRTAKQAAKKTARKTAKKIVKPAAGKAKKAARAVRPKVASVMREVAQKAAPMGAVPEPAVVPQEYVPTFNEEAVGRVTHYYTKLQVAVIRLDRGDLHVGDRIHIKGHTTDLHQAVDSMELEHQKIDRAEAGQVVAIKVTDHVRENDVIYKVH